MTLGRVHASYRLVPAIGAFVSMFTLGVAAQQPTAQRHTVNGMVLRVDAANAEAVISHDSVPGVMAAMTMTFQVRPAAELRGIVSGNSVTFTLVLDGREPHIEQIRVVNYESHEQDPATARRLRLLRHLMSPQSAPLVTGAVVPNFTLIDQRQQTLRLSELRGKTVLVNFIYANCALPQFCVRVTNHFGSLRQRFASRVGKDLMLLTITFDPARDTPERLVEYASQWQADPASWRFLTGPIAEVGRVCAMFGVDFFPDEGLMNHSVHTVLIGSDGRLVANIEGNRYTANQLGDLVASALPR